MIVDMHRFALMCQYRNRFFKVVPNLSRSVGEPILRGFKLNVTDMLGWCQHAIHEKAKAV